jgi:hypothetical protein
MKQRQKDLLTQAEYDRLVERVRNSEPLSPGLLKRLLIGLGKTLVVLGYRLQSRYPDGHGRPETVRNQNQASLSWKVWRNRQNMNI